DVGLSDEAIAALDHPGESIPAPERLVLAFARKLTVNPALITDADVEGLRKHFSDHEVAEVIYHVTQAAFFDRLTEAAGLRLGRAPCRGRARAGLTPSPRPSPSPLRLTAPAPRLESSHRDKP